MINSYEFEAEIRSIAGTRSARSLRRANKVPAVIYGNSEKPLWIALDPNKVAKQLEQKAIYSHILKIRVDGSEHLAILKDLQRHPSKPVILHMDFQRISETQKLRVHVALRFVGESMAVGVKKGGLVTHNMVDVEVLCLAKDLPEHIEVDVSDIDVGQAVNLSDLKVPDGVELAALTHSDGRNIPVASIQVPKAEQESTAEPDDDEGDQPIE